ncbi:MAG: Asp-tRNA(Asn)/Glu-tRNA(Gln) amidotransferase subunit GatC, partial [Patescibacteria group bacterium]|nr:Asp-tRNA(Asn)/Glu-tRNA(Gln) amidotransferase subunit GatC [Patescibacteria group bacterium]
EKKKFTEELSAVLEFIDKLGQIKTDKIEPTAQVTGLENVTREDKRKTKNAREVKKLLDAAPETKDGYVKVKAVL